MTIGPMRLNSKCCTAPASAWWWIRVFPSGVTLADSYILTMDQHLAALTLGSFTRRTYRFALRPMDRGSSTVACSLDRPAALMRHNMLILLSHSMLHMSIFLDNPTTLS